MDYQCDGTCDIRRQAAGLWLQRKGVCKMNSHLLAQESWGWLVISDVTGSERWLVQLLRGVLISFMRSKGPEEVSFAWISSHTLPWDSFHDQENEMFCLPGAKWDHLRAVEVVQPHLWQAEWCFPGGPLTTVLPKVVKIYWTFKGQWWKTICIASSFLF